MKRVFIVAISASFLASCTDSGNKTTVTTGSSDTAVVIDNNAPVASATTVYTPADGDVIMKDGKTMIWKNGVWVATTGNTTMSNGMVITSQGKVTHENHTITLNEGEAVNRTGNFFDRTGAAIDNAWDATKKGVSKAADATGNALKDAGHAIGTGAKKVGNKVADAVDGDNKKK